MTVNQMANMSNIYRNMYVNQTAASKSLRNLSTGYRINSAADDAAGLAVSEKMRGQIGGLSKAGENVQQSINMVQTADGGLSTSSDILNRMKELAVQASNGTYSDMERTLLNQEFSALKDELTRTSTSTNYNNIKLLDGSLDTMFQVGANGSADQQIAFQIGDMSASALGLDGIDITTGANALKAIDAIDAARDQVSLQRGGLSAMVNRLEHTANNINVTRENLVQSESTIRDADMALEMIKYTQKSIQSMASQAMMAQSMNLSRQYMLGILMMG